MTAPAWWIELVAAAMSVGLAAEIVESNQWRGIVRTVANGLWADTNKRGRTCVRKRTAQAGDVRNTNATESIANAPLQES